MEKFKSSSKMYNQRGFGKRLGFGKSPALIIVDFMKAFTQDTYKLGGNYDNEIAHVKKIITTCREKNIPIIYVTTKYHSSLKDGGVFVEKVPSLHELIEGTDGVEVDERIKPEPEDYFIVKKYASSFFGTNLSSLLTYLNIDTVIVSGVTTSGCVRATVVDANQYGYRPIVPQECVGDRKEILHDNNLFDMDMKYGDVLSTEEVVDQLQKL